MAGAGLLGIVGTALRLAWRNVDETELDSDAVAAAYLSPDREAA